MRDIASNMNIARLNDRSLKTACIELANSDSDLRVAFAAYGSPPLWDRSPGFVTLLQIILEQQVSLASAAACYGKLSAQLGNVTPETLLRLDDATL